MPLTVNLRHLEDQGLRLQGQLPAAELDIETRDEAITLAQPLDYDLEVQKLDDSLLVQGSLQLPLECQCVRCLKPFQYRVRLESWACHLALQGEDKVAVTNDYVDLTPQVREDILLEFPRHPVCGSECRGVPTTPKGEWKNTSTTGQSETTLPAWAELNKLKL